ncbi:hypothetical protein TNCV_3232541 [Trichonephila clavipes]|nr:hypothetical protein TNCV_3232541 [Trichonephila clavipes]
MVVWWVPRIHHKYISSRHHRLQLSSATEASTLHSHVLPVVRQMPLVLRPHVLQVVRQVLLIRRLHVLLVVSQMPLVL